MTKKFYVVKFCDLMYLMYCYKITWGHQITKFFGHEVTNFNAHQKLTFIEKIQSEFSVLGWKKKAPFFDRFFDRFLSKIDLFERFFDRFLIPRRIVDCDHVCMIVFIYSKKRTRFYIQMHKNNFNENTLQFYIQSLNAFNNEYTNFRKI